MKRITLNFRDNPHGDHEPFSSPVLWETETDLCVKPKWARGELILTKNPDGTFTNGHKVVFVKVKRDNRPKPYSVEYHSGIGEGNCKKKFATLAEVQEYVKGRWLGTDYIDGSTVFYNDYGHFWLKGCSLSDIGNCKDEWEWEWKEVA